MIDKTAVRVGDSLQWRTRPPHKTTSYGRVIELSDSGHPDRVRVQTVYGRYWVPWERVIRHEPGRALADAKVLP